MTRYLTLLTLVACTLIAHGQDTDKAGQERILGQECSLSAQYAIAGSALDEMQLLKKWLESDQQNKKSDVICAIVREIHGMSFGMNAIIMQEAESTSTDSTYHGLGFGNFSTVAAQICEEAQKRGTPVNLTPNELSKIATKTKDFQTYLVGLRAKIIKANPRLAPKTH